MRYKLTKYIYIYIYIGMLTQVLTVLKNSTRHPTRLVTLIFESVHLKINIISVRGYAKQSG